MSDESLNMNDMDSKVRDQSAGAAVIGNNLIAFASGLARADKLDVMACSRAIPLLTDEDFLKRDGEWFDRYLASFKLYGGDSEPYAQNNKVKVNPGVLAIRAELDAIAKAQGSATERFENEAMKYLRNNKAALSAFESASQKFESVNFQILTCNAGPDGLVNVGLYFNRFDYKKKTKNFLFFEREEEYVNKFEASQIFQFDCSAYRREHRESVSGYLAGHVAQVLSTVVLY